MTLSEICKLIRHYVVIFSVVVLMGALIGLAFGYVNVLRSGEAFTAKAILTVSEPTGFVSADELMPLTEAVATNALAEDDFADADISLEYDLKERTLVFNAKAATKDESIALANAAAARTAELTDSILQKLAVQSWDEGETSQTQRNANEQSASLSRSDINRALALESVVFTVNDATDSSSQSGIKGMLKYGVVGLFAGLFLAICIVVVIYLVRDPVWDRDEIEEHFDVPVLVDGPSEQLGRQLWANIQFAYEGDTPSSVCLLPVAKTEIAGVEQQLSDAILGWSLDMEEAKEKGYNDSDNVVLSACAPLSEDVNAVYIAHMADVTVVVVKKWQDSMKQLADVLRQLSLAKANIAGIVLLR